MKKLLAIAALLLASTAAQAQYTFEYGGRTIRVDPDRGTVSIPGVYDNTGRKAKRSRNEDGDRDRPRKQSPQQAKTDPQTTPDAAARRGARSLGTSRCASGSPACSSGSAPSTPEPSTTTAAVAPADTVTSARAACPACPARAAGSRRCGRAARTSRTRTCPGGCSGMQTRRLACG